ncbi:hypothetical protein A6P39_012300 [Streptomyces sp. FXJ1.172]|uniref:hypothetical protein n=1 Tax=Streptomyces sp. FXJ1.172 TaxID=710705 RepID=UPI0007D00634|nr:hypothetical protein [Streptomyces sp. FXJ1.172]WEO94724.1 hypothetical protein A6P39_012300 [Streptomyces sp. FXJ1.172]
MARTVPRTDVLITLMGAPHESDLLTSTLRLTQAVLDRGASVQIWACGYATLLTQRALGDSKPRNLAAWSTDYPSAGRVVRRMLAAHPGALYWYACRFCSDDRGAFAHIPEVPVRAPARYAEHVAAAAKTLHAGVM